MANAYCMKAVWVTLKAAKETQNYFSVEKILKFYSIIHLFFFVSVFIYFEM